MKALCTSVLWFAKLWFEQLQLDELIQFPERAGGTTSHSLADFLLRPVSDALKGGDFVDNASGQPQKCLTMRKKYSFLTLERLR